MGVGMKKVTKHWGNELWIADGKDTPYATKRILFLAGNRTSLQVHQYKIETNYVLSGIGILHRSKEPLDIEKFMSVEKLSWVEKITTPEGDLNFACERCCNRCFSLGKTYACVCLFQSQAIICSISAHSYLNKKFFL